jgi:hypothetical protein
MPLKAATREILGQLTSVLSQLNNEEYAERLPVLSDNTIGKHVRHVLEFYDLLLTSYTTGELNYDRRRRDLVLEMDVATAVERIERIMDAVASSDLNRPLKLEADLAEGFPVAITSSFDREILYNLEHAIHHMALIQIALNDSFTHVVLPAHFGVAYSTVQYQLK